MGPSPPSLPSREGGRGGGYQLQHMPYQFHTAQFYTDSLHALLATPIEFQLEVGPRAADAEVAPATILGDGFPLEIQAAFSQLVLDWEATIHFPLPAAEAPPAGTYALTWGQDGALHATSDDAYYPIADRAVVVGLLSVPERE